MSVESGNTSRNMRNAMTITEIMTAVKASIIALVLICGVWGYHRIDSLSEQLTTAQESVQRLEATAASQKELDITRAKLDTSVRQLRSEIETTNTLTRRLFNAIDPVELRPDVIDGLHKGCTSLGVPCLPK